MTRYLPVLAAVTSLMAAGCDGSAGELANENTTFADSAGVQIVDNTTPSWSPEDAWVVDGEPTVDIGVEEGPPQYAFGHAHSPVRLSTGEIVVADMQTNMMHFYDPDGQWVTSAGGSGQGPGEFEQLYRMRRIAGDSLMALNPASLTSIFAPTGQYVRRFDLDPVRGRSNLWWLGRLANNTLVVFSLERKGTVVGPPRDDAHEATYQRPDRPPLYRDSLLYMLFTMEGQLIDSIAELPGQFMGENRVYAPNAAHAFFEDVFYHSPGDRIEIRAFRARESPGREMQLQRIIRGVPPRGTAVSDDVKERYFERERQRYAAMRASGSGAPNDAALNRRLAETEFPPFLPAHANRMYADANGNLWLQEYALDEDEAASWLVFDPDGRWLGSVQTPPRFTVGEIGADYVLGIWRDELDVQHIRLYGLRKP